MYSSISLTLLALYLSSTVDAHPTARSSQDKPTVIDKVTNVIYIGNSSNGVESFLNIQFGEDTSGENRFAPPKPYSYPCGSTVDASAPGAACPQPMVPFQGIDIFSNVTDPSEDCLTLRVDRPANTTSDAKLPVLLWIYGGGDTIGQVYDQAYDPTGLVVNSALQGTPIIYAAMNYRLGFLGFSAFPKGNTTAAANAGLLDQRLGMHWVQDHIESFGGDPNNVTIFGESDGGTAIGLHILAFGGSQPAPFKGAIMESGSATADTGVAGQYIEMQSQELTAQLNCTNGDVGATVECLRNIPITTLLPAMNQYEYAINPEAGFDVFKPTVDGSFLPDAPSKLLRQGKFSKNISTIIGWNEDDGAIFTLPAENFTDPNFLAAYLPSLFPGNTTDAQIQTILQLYNGSSFAAEQAMFPSVPVDWFRASQINRDSGFTCPALLMAESLNTSTYVYALNASLFLPFLADGNMSYNGIIHFSDIPYVFNQAIAFNASDDQVAFASQVSESWIEFAYSGSPSAAGGALTNWPEAGKADDLAVRILGINQTDVVHIGGQSGTTDFELLTQRCAFWNDPDFLLNVYQS